MVFVLMTVVFCIYFCQETYISIASLLSLHAKFFRMFFLGVSVIVLACLYAFVVLSVGIPVLLLPMYIGFAAVCLYLYPLLLEAYFMFLFCHFPGQVDVGVVGVKGEVIESFADEVIVLFVLCRGAELRLKAKYVGGSVSPVAIGMRVVVHSLDKDTRLLVVSAARLPCEIYF